MTTGVEAFHLKCNEKIYPFFAVVQKNSCSVKAYSFGNNHKLVKSKSNKNSCEKIFDTYRVSIIRSDWDRNRKISYLNLKGFVALTLYSGYTQGAQLQ